MSQKIKPILIQSLLVIVLSVLMVSAIVYAWTEPKVSPPDDNIPAPINIGNVTQSKLGGLGINGVFQSWNYTEIGVNSDSDNKIGIGRNSVVQIGSGSDSSVSIGSGSGSRVLLGIGNNAYVRTYYKTDLATKSGGNVNIGMGLRPVIFLTINASCL